jgi:hypothetical protein
MTAQITKSKFLSLEMEQLHEVAFFLNTCSYVIS